MKTSFKAPEVKRACAGAETTGRPGLTGSPNTVPTWAVYISEKVSGESHVTKDQRGGVSHLKTEVWKHTHIFICTYISTYAPRRWVARSRVLSKKVKSQQDRRIFTNFSPNGRVEVVPLNCCYKTIKWLYPFLIGLARGLQSDYCI